jgi:hypothetical protein
MKRIFAAFFLHALMFYPAAAFAADARPETEKKLVGLWHGSPVLGSGWNRRLLIGEDGTFLWAESQMDAVSPLRFKRGAWKLDSGNLILRVAELLIREGGKVADSPIYIGGERTGYTVKWYLKRGQPETETVEIGEFGYFEELNRDTVTFDGIEFWLYAGDHDVQTIKDDYEAMRDQAE